MGQCRVSASDFHNLRIIVALTCNAVIESKLVGKLSYSVISCSRSAARKWHIFLLFSFCFAFFHREPFDILLSVCARTVCVVARWLRLASPARTRWSPSAVQRFCTATDQLTGPR